jgi:hypothetical protein
MALKLCSDIYESKVEVEQCKLVPEHIQTAYVGLKLGLTLTTHNRLDLKRLKGTRTGNETSQQNNMIL